MLKTGTLPIGIEHNGTLYRDYSLEEERFRHKLEVYTDPAVAEKALEDPAYHAAAILARRLIIPGIDRIETGKDGKPNVIPGRGVTPEMVLDLFQEDGTELGMAGAELVGRRLEFRSKAGDKGPAGDGDSADQDRVPPAGAAGNEPGRDAGSPAGT